MENMIIFHPEYHMFFNQVITRHETEVVVAIMNQLSLNSGLKRWGKKGGDEINSYMRKLHTRYIFLQIYWKNMSHE